MLLTLIVFSASLSGVFLSPAQATEPIPLPAPQALAATTPKSGTTVFAEDFQNQSATTDAIQLPNYVGQQNGVPSRYLAGPNWLPKAIACNGWVMSPLSSMVSASSVDSRCDHDKTWAILGSMARAAAQHQGRPANEWDGNRILTVITNGQAAVAGGVVFQTAQPIVTGVLPGHYYQGSATYIGTNCDNSPPSMTFGIIENHVGTGPNPGGGGGTPVSLSHAVNPCAGTEYPFSSGGTSFPSRVLHMNSGAYKLPPNTTSLGLRVTNLNGYHIGNDGAVDNLRLTDVTPQLSTAFSTDRIAPDKSVTFTMTVTNTDDLLAKADWNITNNLPGSLVIADAPNYATTCQDNAGAALSVSVPAKSNSFSITGADLRNGQASCTVSFDVTSANEGAYTNGPAQFSTNLLPPVEAAVVNVWHPRLGLSMALGSDRDDNSDQFTMAIRTNSITGTILNNPTDDPRPLSSTTAGSGSTVTAETGDTGKHIASVDNTYFFVESASGTTNLSNYQSSITCRDSSGLQPGLPNNAPYDPGNPSSIVPVSGAQIDCIISNTAKPSINVSKQAGAVTGPDELGNYVANYTVQVTNSGASAGSYGPLTDTPAFALNLAPTSASWTTSGAGAPASGSAAGPGPYGLTTVDAAIGARATHTYNASVTFKYTNAAQASACGGSGTGLFSTVSLPDDQESVKNDNSACIEPPAPPAPATTLTTDPSTSTLLAGEALTFTVAAKNTGNVQLTNSRILPGSFTEIGATPTLSACSPALGSTMGLGTTMTCTASYQVQQADVDRGILTYTASSVGTSPGGDDIARATTTTLSAAANPSILVSKSANESGVHNPTRVGDTITYSYTATNSGNVTLTGVTITDPLPGLGALAYTWPVAPATPGTLLPGEKVTATASYAVTQTDIDAGIVASYVTAAGASLAGVTVTSAPQSTNTTLHGTPGILVSTSVDETGLHNPTQVGDIITYTHTASNSGNVTLSGVIITDPLPGLGPLTYTWPAASAPGTLRPDETVTGTVSYAVTQTDIDNGTVTSNATATGLTTGSGIGTTAPPLNTALHRTTSILVSTSTDETGLHNPTRVGDTITYNYTATNTGNATLTGVTITDPLIGIGTLTYTWPAAPAPAPAAKTRAVSGTLLPGQSVSATASYAITQTDIDTGIVTSNATAAGTTTGGATITAVPGTAAVTLITTPVGSTGSGSTGEPGSQSTSVKAEVNPLASTGASLLLLPIGAALLAGGLATFAAIRRRSNRA